MYIPAKKHGHTLETSASLRVDFKGQHSGAITVAVTTVGQAGSPDRTLTPDERKKRAKLLDGLAERLAAAAQDTEAVAREAPPDRQRVLQEIVNTAQDGQRELQKLAKEGA